ncbi:unnamed protein product [Leptosia nina]|uniref:Uncharacterized protein n=1 Tax=Leptosia nina TaxID=320188 RepID=A0AAV1J6Z3_9NEOP
MEGYSYPYASPFSPPAPDRHFPDHGDCLGDYYELGSIPEDKNNRRKSRPKQMKTKRERGANRSRSKSRTSLSDRSHVGSVSRSASGSRSQTRSPSRSRRSGSIRDLTVREPSFLDAFRVMYLTPSKHKKSTTKYLATKKRLDRIQEILKSDGLGSKRWLLYPRPQRDHKVPDNTKVPATMVPRDCDHRVKIDGHFFRKYKRSKHVDKDAPIAKLKRWELMFYKKLGFIQPL